MSAGFRSIGFDVDQNKVDQLNRGQSYIKHIPSGWIAQSISQGTFVATTDLKRST